MLPNFLIIGAQKCGTTWIHNILKDHPEVYLPKIKETFFFDRRYNKGIEWYMKFFKRYKNEKAIGEVAPSYLNNKLAPIRIKNQLGEITLICCIRNPIEASYSKYLHCFRAGLVGKDFIKATKKYPFILENFLFSNYIKNYLKYFNYLNFLYFDELKNNPIKYYKNLCKILNINKNIIPSELNKKVNIKKYPRYHLLSRTKLYISQFLSENDLFDIRYILSKFFPDILFYSSKIPKGVNFKIEYKKFLINYYKKEISNLEKLLNKDFSNWIKLKNIH